MKALSIMIPTFERKKELSVSLATILDGCDDAHLQRIEILIIDNHSSYDIKETLDLLRHSLGRDVDIQLLINDKNIGNDRNFLKGLQNCTGRYILQCSDRYSYHIDFNRLVDVLEKSDCFSVMLSDRLRAYSMTEVELISSKDDAWIGTCFDVSQESAEYFDIPAIQILENGYIERGVISTFSDLIMLNRGPDYYEQTLTPFLDTHMLGVTAQLDSMSHTLNSLKDVRVIKVSANIVSHKNIGKGNIFNRHDYNEVFKGNLLIQETYPFIGSKEDIELMQAKGLLKQILEHKAGVYLSLVLIDASVVKSVYFKAKNLTIGDRVDAFIAFNPWPSRVVLAYLIFKKIYISIRRDVNALLNTRRKVMELKRDLKY